MSRAEREKGKRGEREVAALLVAYGFDARRDGRLDVDLVHNVDDVHFEVKRCETLRIPEWWRQALGAAAPDGREVVLAFRTSKTAWRAVVDLEFLLALLALRRRET